MSLDDLDDLMPCNEELKGLKVGETRCFDLDISKSMPKEVRLIDEKGNPIGEAKRMRPIRESSNYISVP